MTYLIGDNVHAQKMSSEEKTAYLELLKKNQPTLEVVMDNFEFARQIQDTLPNCIVIHRDYIGVGGDDNLCGKMPPADWLTLQRNKGDFRIVRYTCNESGWNQQVIDWHISLIKLNAANPIPLKLCILNLGVGQPKPEEWQQGKELLQLASQHKEHVLIGLHEYAGGIVTSGFIGGAPDDSRHKNFIPVANWPTLAESKTMTMWHMGRFKFLNLYCASEGISPVRIAITEFGFDHTGDIDAWLNTLQKTDPYTSIRAWKSLKNQWLTWFNSLGWSHERAYAEQLEYARKVIYEGTNVVGMTVYCAYLANNDWQEFDISKADEFQKWRTSFATVSTPPTIPPVTPPPIPVPPTEKMVTIPLALLTKIRQELQGDVDITRRYALQLGTLSDDMMADLDLIDAIIRKAVES